MRDEIINIYLAGAMSNYNSFEEMNKWRENVTVELQKVAERYVQDLKLNVINPCLFYNSDDPRPQNNFEIMQYDLSKVRKSNIIIVNLEKINESIGTAIEIYDAHNIGIPILALDLNKEYSNVHPWLRCCLTRVEDNINDLIEYIERFYMYSSVAFDEYYHIE